MKVKNILFILALLLYQVASANASSIIGLPAEVIETPSGGGAFQAGGHTRTLSNVNFTDYLGLWFGLPQVALATDGNAFDEASEDLTLSSVSPSEAIWTGSSNVVLTSGPDLNVELRFRLTASGFHLPFNTATTPLPPGFEPTGPPLPSDATDNVLINITGDASFTMFAEARDLGSSDPWQPSGVYYDAINNKAQSGQLRTEIWFGYLHTIPEPSTLLLGTLSSVGFLLRRRR